MSLFSVHSVLGGALTGVLLAGLLGSLAPPRAAAAEREVEWGECLDLDARGQEGLECSQFTAPLDHSAPNGPRIALSVARVPAAEVTESTLVVHPGGPGAPGRPWAAVIAERLPRELRDTVDVVAFDQRGVGASEPELSCDPHYFTSPRPDPVPEDSAAARTLMLRALGHARACVERNGEALEHLRSDQTVHDTELLRQALGAGRIDYLGYSYGAYLGAGYAAAYPDTLRRLVLDSSIHPGFGWNEQVEARIDSMDALAGRFFAWVADHHGDYGLGRTGEEVAAAYAEVRTALAEHPAGGVMGPAEFDSTSALVAYTSASWPHVADALADHAGDSNPRALQRLNESWGQDEDSDPGYAAYLATTCTDSAWPKESEQWLERGEQAAERSPFRAWQTVWHDAPCAFWPRGEDFWTQVHGFETDDALIVHGEHDGPAPLAGAFAMRERFPDSRMVVEGGGVDHGVSLRGNGCVDDAVLNYLAEGLLPEADDEDGVDLLCPTSGEPEPQPRGSEPEGPEFDLRTAR